MDLLELMMEACGDETDDEGHEARDKGQRLMKSGAWSREEDEVLCQLVVQHGTKPWSRISGLIAIRTGKQCRERWCNHLRGGITKEAWTADEVRTLLDMQSRIGNKWAEIAAHLRGRSDNCVKNKFNALRRPRVVKSVEPSVTTVAEPGATRSAVTKLVKTTKRELVRPRVTKPVKTKLRERARPRLPPPRRKVGGVSIRVGAAARDSVVSLVSSTVDRCDFVELNAILARRITVNAMLHPVGTSRPIFRVTKWGTEPGV